MLLEYRAGGRARARACVAAALIGGSALLAGSAAWAADASHPVVVELFQSQGCSSCPPANANVNALSERPDVLALSYAVTYWDGLGWKDTFAKQTFTDRQWDYARALRHDSVFTPEVVINGRLDGVGTEHGEIEALMRRGDRGGAGPSVAISGESVEIGASEAPARPADVWLVRYDPRTLEVSIRRGENAGKTLPHRNIVREITRLGSWSGNAERFSLPNPAEPDVNTAILVQATGAGPILAAAKQ
jgi:hypothetical protein